MVHSLQHDFGDSEGRLGDSVLIWSVEKAGPLVPDSRGRRIERIPTVGLGQRCRFGWLQSSKPLCAPIHPSSQPPAQGEALLNRDPVFTALTEQLEKRLQKFKDEERDMSREEIPSMGLTGLGMSLSSPFFLLLSFLGCKGNALCGCGHLGLSQERGTPPHFQLGFLWFLFETTKKVPSKKDPPHLHRSPKRILSGERLPNFELGLPRAVAWGRRGAGAADSEAKGLHWAQANPGACGASAQADGLGGAPIKHWRLGFLPYALRSPSPRYEWCRSPNETLALPQEMPLFKRRLWCPLVGVASLLVAA